MMKAGKPSILPGKVSILSLLIYHSQNVMGICNMISFFSPMSYDENNEAFYWINSL
jgi:hypothetical protein